jgi:hypothetical protein
VRGCHQSAVRTLRCDSVEMLLSALISAGCIGDADEIMIWGSISCCNSGTGRPSPRSSKRVNSTGCCESHHLLRGDLNPLVGKLTMRFRRCFRLVSVADTLGAYDVYGSSIDAGRSQTQNRATTSRSLR